MDMITTITKLQNSLLEHERIQTEGDIQSMKKMLIYYGTFWHDNDESIRQRYNEVFTQNYKQVENLLIKCEILMRI